MLELILSMKDQLNERSLEELQKVSKCVIPKVDIEAEKIKFKRYYESTKESEFDSGISSKEPYSGLEGGNISSKESSS